ncbi:GerMN domain-containing protein [uncultured Megamonas sp.]|uniref:GerMN domain-containing protein n=1 Tax=uncultured Megamonas sp. TaxID=286140 RepID=UPI0025FB297F|nr:GerMN domain-containing protein [uncultured Megamonas sp.]
MKIKLKSVKGILAILAVSILTIASGCTEQATNLESSSSNTTTAQVNKDVKSSSSSSAVNDAEQSSEKKVAGVTIYFPDANGEKLIPTQRQINLSREDKYQAVVQALIDGPISDKEGIYIMPKDTQVLSVKVKDNIATVDFNKAFKTNFTGGSTGELMLIGSIVNSLTEFTEIKAVRFTVEGKVLEALDGHLDLTVPQERMGDLL